ncbi:DUF4097 family beta strand repeat-containing protein [Actinomadura hibisca]|uniref:DUF4097 family beta strand repeat-containing protein n=1 Tax=Actinomadura hibisca TaxID=68565 RepID=UPI00082B1E5E|nr:DUF4097 family beta strand repeat-containing protein [Actinomadura hibisca]
MPTFATPEPISVRLDVVGAVHLNASDRADTAVTVVPRNPRDSADVRAAEQTRVDLSGDLLVIKMPRERTLRTLFRWGGRVEVTLDLPAGSRLHADAVAAFHSTGALGETRIRTGHGDIRLARTGPAELSTDHGSIDLDEADGDLRLGTLHGDITVGRSRGEVDARTAHGAIRVGRAAASVAMDTTCGDLEVGIADGLAAWLDVRTLWGRVRNELTPAGGPPEEGGTVRVHAHSGTGDILIRRG